MRRLVFALGFVMSQPAFADWLTLTGTPGDPGSDSIQVDPTSLHSNGDIRLLDVRVSRSAQRVNAEGITYRSYDSKIAVNCRESSARYTWARFFASPNFQGDINREKNYPDVNLRPVLFWGIPGGHVGRLIRAACRAGEIGQVSVDVP
ncbi:MAG: hypothetical protein EON56_06325 [Alphaproteobacteria bacterium]|nr:MAG: hypothetical protein EON56_06325 [Alphaproteobacteria bacterium]